MGWLELNARHLREQARAAGITPHEVANRVRGKLSRSTVYRILSGAEAEPHWRSLEHIAAALNVPLLHREDISEPLVAEDVASYGDTHAAALLQAARQSGLVRELCALAKRLASMSRHEREAVVKALACISHSAGVAE